MKWVTTLAVLAAAGLALALLNWDRLRQLKPAVIDAIADIGVPRRTPADAVTPAIKHPDWHQKFLERTKQGDIGVLFLGDSLTEWWPNVGKESWDRLSKYNPANFG